jgi:hypothetical protein
MLSTTNQYIVLLDACVLAPMPLCDLLLRLAEEPAFFVPRWSADILREVSSTLRKFGYSDAQVERRLAGAPCCARQGQVGQSQAPRRLTPVAARSSSPTLSFV